MGGGADVGGDVGCDLLVVVKESCFGVWDPGGEEASGVGRHCVDGFSVGIG